MKDVKTRLLASQPNVQNFPVRTNLGRAIRRAFSSGYKHLLVVSYEDLETRIMLGIRAAR